MATTDKKISDITEEETAALKLLLQHIAWLVRSGSLPYGWTMDQLRIMCDGPRHADTCPWPPWRDIQVGIGPKTGDGFRRALQAHHYELGTHADNTLSRPEFVVATQPAVVPLIRVSNADLGRPQGCTRQETYDLARVTSYLDLCEPGDGAELRLQYPDQPLGEFLLMAMQPIAGPDGRLYGFTLVHDSLGYHFNADNGAPDGWWSGDKEWVFRRRQ